MIFKHRVKLNGVFYETGQEVPVEEENSEKGATVKPVVETPKVEEPVKSSEKVVEDKVLTKAELIEIAKSLGIEGVTTKLTNAKIQEMISNAEQEAEDRIKNELSSGIKGTILTSESPVNEEVNITNDGNEEETGNEDSEESSFLNEVIKGNE